MSEFSFSLDEYSGTARLFPVPGLIMFPHVMQPLHIFEPRYRDLLADAMSGDRLIGLAVPAADWEENYEGSFAVEPMACLAKVVSQQELPDGRSNIVVMGMQRIQIIEELPSVHSFREAIAEPIEDFMSSQSVAQRKGLHSDLLEGFMRELSQAVKKLSCLEELLRADISLAVLTDIVAHTLNLDSEVKLKLLGEPNVDKRARVLLGQFDRTCDLAQLAGQGRGFPPQFSAN